MALETKVRKIGNSVGIVLAKEALNALKVEGGASLYLSEALVGCCVARRSSRALWVKSAGRKTSWIISSFFDQ